MPPLTKEQKEARAEAKHGLQSQAQNLPENQALLVSLISITEIARTWGIPVPPLRTDITHIEFLPKEIAGANNRQFANVIRSAIRSIKATPPRG